jgi:hypothetical protein
MIKIGSFVITTGKVMISDPCYEVGTWCQETEDFVRKGAWNAWIKQKDEGNWGMRNSWLIACHEKFRPTSLKWENKEANIGVDSGQAGIYDTRFYRRDEIISKDQIGTICSDEPWYSANCKLTCETDMGAGVLEYGCVSNSGFGDGNYQHSVAISNKEIVGIRIRFI